VPGRHVHNQVLDLPGRYRFEMLADDVDVPTVYIGNSWLDYTPSFPNEIS
jgi:hypothetical protein